MGLEQYSGTEKAAMLLITLGPERAAQIFQHLKEDEIEAVTLQIASTSIVLPELKEEVLKEFYELCVAQEYIAEGGFTYAKELLTKALGSDKAHEIISKLAVSMQVKPFEFIRKYDVSQVINFIQNEHPQTIALILAYLKPEYAGQVLGALPQEKQADIAKRIALMDRTNPEVIQEIENVLERKLSSLDMSDFADIGGVDTIVEILNAVDRGTEKNIMESLETENAELSEEIKNKMFVFEDILTLDNRSIQMVLREDIDNKEIAIALKGSSQQVQDIIFANVSSRLADMIKEEIDFMGPVRRSDVEEAQQKIVNVVRRLQESGDIIIARGGGDDLIV